MILSAALVDKDGEIYVARQFCPMTRAKVEALYLAFSRLKLDGKQHTYIETGEVRYVYQCINEFYCVLITGKDSNILEDLKTLRVFVGAINEYGSLEKGQITEESITKYRFDLLLVFEEIAAFGIRQVEDLTQLRTVLEMESEEEKAFMETISKKEREASRIRAEKAKELDQQRRNEALRQSDRAVNRVSSRPVPTEPVVVEAEAKPKPTRVMSRGRAMKLK